MRYYLRKIWYKLFPCKHEWIPGEQFWDERQPGVDHSYLKPSPMLYYPKYQTVCYVCKKCNESIITIEKIEKDKDDKQKTVKEKWNDFINSNNETN